MPKITFIQHDGQQQDVNAKDGDSLMKSATSHGVSGIDADCGGACACATCHVFIADDWISMVGEKSEDEDDILELSSSIRPTSRLSCQIKVSSELDGLVVYIPETQD